MKKLDRHDYILVARRRRQRAVDNRPQVGKRIGQSLAVMLLSIAIAVTAVVGVAAGTVVGIYNNYAAQLPDVGLIEQQQDKFQTVRIYDRTGQNLLYESVDPRPFSGDRTYLKLDRMTDWVWKAAVALDCAWAW